MNRRAILESLLRFDQPLPELEAALASLDEDSAPAATLTRSHIALVVRRFEVGLLEAEAVARWADLIECREDIEFEARHEPAVADALFDLANPDLQGPLAEISADVLAVVER